ncbi:MAG: hypothetical protein ISR65_06915 [Bacteriovoracaceae bacterium]|nr:hypothetical protein [Bacteriovoracaceae bacterium]
MKYFTLLISLLLFNLSVFAQQNFTIESVWKSTTEDSGKRYLAVVRQDRGGSDFEFVIIFGNKNGKLKKRVFGLQGMSFYAMPGITLKSSDARGKFELVGIQRDESVEVKLGATFKTQYKRYKSTRSLSFAKVVTQMALIDKESTLANQNPQTMREFKRILQTLVTYSAFFDHSLEDGTPHENFYYPVYDLQIEFGLTLSNRNRAMAQAEISEDGMDLITKKYRQSSVWYESATVVKDLIDELLARDYYQEVPVYSIYRPGKKVEGFTAQWLKDAAAKFVKYEIQNMSGYDCEGGWTIYHSDFTWILADGSTFSYSPLTECD